jgi:DNA-binding IclR family transcriptional regulator
MAAERNEAVVAQLKDQPGMTTAAVVKASGRKPTTTATRLQRLVERGLVQRDDGGAWSLSTQT